MYAKVGLRLDILIVVGVVSCLVDVLIEGDVHERLKSGSTSVPLLA